MSPGVLRKQAYLIWAEKTITPATLWASLPLSFSFLIFLFLPKVIPEIERKRLSQITSSSLNFRDDSCFLPFPASSILAPTEFDWTNIASVGRLVYNLKGMKTRTMRRFDATGTLSQAPADLSTQP